MVDTVPFQYPIHPSYSLSFSIASTRTDTADPLTCFHQNHTWHNNSTTLNYYWESIARAVASLKRITDVCTGSQQYALKRKRPLRVKSAGFHNEISRIRTKFTEQHTVPTTSTRTAA